MKNTISGACRLSGFDKPTVWTLMTPLAVKTQSVNLGQGFPGWQPPEFYRKFLQQAVATSNHQYGRSFGSLNYTKAIAEFHRPTFGQLDHENNICVTNGGVEALYCSIMGLVNPGEEVIVFDPSYDCYRPQVQMAGGKTIGIPLIPRKTQSKEELLKKTSETILSDYQDQWDIDFDSFEKAINQKTKIVIINSPHNPIGKVFTQQELERVAKILEKHPHVAVIEDNVYEGVTFDDMYQKKLPKVAFIESMKDRTISIYSAGKIFAATGMRSGWMIGASPLIRAARSVHQYNVFCFYNPIENAAAKSIEEISKPDNTYLSELATKLTKGRNLLIQQLLAANFNWSLWIPKGGYFVLADISKVDIKEQYFYDEEGNKRTRDYAFAYQLAYENKVVCIPMSPFYDSKNVGIGEKYVRFAFCKDEETLLEAGKRLKQ